MMPAHCHRQRAARAFPGTRQRRGQGGFTLLELLLATGIGATVLLVINTTFFSALRLHNTTHEKIDDDLVIQRTLGIIRKDLAGIMLPANPQATTYTLSGQLTTEGATTTDLDNTSQRITPDIYTNSGRIDGWTPFADVQSVAYYLAPATDGASSKNLVRLITRNLLPVAEATSEQQTLLKGVSAAAISYFDGESWVETWDTTTSNTLPTAIKFSLVMAPRESFARIDPAPIELIVPVVVTTPTSAQETAAAATGL